MWACRKPGTRYVISVDVMFQRFYHSVIVFQDRGPLTTIIGILLSIPIMLFKNNFDKLIEHLEEIVFKCPYHLFIMFMYISTGNSSVVSLDMMLNRFEASINKVTFVKTLVQLDSYPYIWSSKCPPFPQLCY